MENSSNIELASDGETVTSYSSFDADNSSLASIKVDCDSSLSSWDSEAETDIQSVIDRHDTIERSFEGINLEENYLAVKEEQDQFVGVENTDDGLLWEIDNRSYDELVKKFLDNEEELRASDFKLQLLEQENVKLKAQVLNSKVHLDNVREDLKNKEERLRKQKELSEEEILKQKIQFQKSQNQIDYMQGVLKLKDKQLEKQTAELSCVPSYVEKITNLEEQLKISKDEISVIKVEIESKSIENDQLQVQLNLAEKCIAKLDSKCVTGRMQIKMLRESVTNYEANETNYKLEVQQLKDEMFDSQEQFSLEKDEWHSEIASLLEMKMELTSRNNELEDKLSQYEAEKLKQEELHAIQQMDLEDEISYLKKELGNKKNVLQVVKNGFNKLVIERDETTAKMMMERDETTAKIDKLEAEICSRDEQITHLNRYILMR